MADSVVITNITDAMIMVAGIVVIIIDINVAATTATAASPMIGSVGGGGGLINTGLVLLLVK